MISVVAIVGRPNVGKSTLFNQLTKTRDALVSDFPGVTRDRQYGRGAVGDRPYFVIDTGGLEEQHDPKVGASVTQQVELALDEADVVLFMVDAQVGLTVVDEAVAERLRSISDKVILVVNKTDHHDPNVICAEFYALGLGDPLAIAAKRGQGIKNLVAEAFSSFPLQETVEEVSGIKVAIVGRPNVGKSTLINRILGEERVVVLDRPGTTRDSIYIPFERRDKKYVLIDTAGVHRKIRKVSKVEQLSIVKTWKAMEDSHVVVMVLNAREGITEQDLRLLGLVVESGKALIFAVNKWDEMDKHDREDLQREMDRRLPFVSFARRYFISALHGSGVGLLYRAIDEAYAAASQTITTSELTKALEKAVVDHEPPLVRGRRVKLRYAHLGGHHPMIVLVHGKQTDALPLSYKRYLTNYLRRAFNLVGVPLIVRFRTDRNPYATR